ncbi:DeoR/GlpR family DNA-binding transcription regulator [Mucilaginibacter lappiensis]|uniref:DeoR family transcriptional regulator of aga operon n=1 Tax=Mucilaginibacter lappiensis TaxID=354630 RepID=A0A841JHH1_9SPHI|nr:DeoR/GlpR family DNA-binding transcription regulator [Mucilaginibacter lappiensis]MBB6127905.1 DeoR family transcriptional regulator of aga operon [Mucilaginibacter lappiensis]
MINLTERHQYIINKMQKEGYVEVVNLCKELKVSSVTIRKDLKYLEEKNLLFRTHGGATQSNPYTTDRPVNEKEKIKSNEKMRIGAAAAGLIGVNDSIILASGTTIQAFAKSIQAREALTVITSSLNVAIELIHAPGVEVLQLGGMIRKSSSSVMGTYAENILKDFFCSMLFLGVDGIDIEYGLTTTNAMEAHLNKQMMAISNKTIVLADSTKFGKRGFGKICNIDEIDQIITDDQISDHVVNTLESAGVTVTIA